MSAKEAFPFHESMTEITEKALVLAARVVGTGLARTIERYVPPGFAGRFAAHLVEELLHEVHESSSMDATRSGAFRQSAS